MSRHFESLNDLWPWQIVGFGCWILDIGCWVLDVGCWVLGVGCWVLEQRRKIKDVSVSYLEIEDKCGSVSYLEIEDKCGSVSSSDSQNRIENSDKLRQMNK